MKLDLTTDDIKDILNRIKVHSQKRWFVNTVNQEWSLVYEYEEPIVTIDGVQLQCPPCHVIDIRRNPTHPEFRMTEQEWIFFRFNYNNFVSFYDHFGYRVEPNMRKTADEMYLPKYLSIIKNTGYTCLSENEVQQILEAATVETILK